MGKAAQKFNFFSIIMMSSGSVEAENLQDTGSRLIQPKPARKATVTHFGNYELHIAGTATNYSASV